VLLSFLEKLSFCRRLVHVVHKELFPAFDPRAVAADTTGIVRAVLVSMASLKTNTIPHTDSCELFPTFDPWAVALDCVDLI